MDLKTQKLESIPSPLVREHEEKPLYLSITVSWPTTTDFATVTASSACYQHCASDDKLLRLRQRQQYLRHIRLHIVLFFLFSFYDLNNFLGCFFSNFCCGVPWYWLIFQFFHFLLSPSPHFSQLGFILFFVFASSPRSFSSSVFFFSFTFLLL